MPTESTSTAPVTTRLEYNDNQPDLAKIITDCIKALAEVRALDASAPRLFFPDGIQEIHLSVTVGPKNSPIFSADLDVKGDRGKPSILGGNVLLGPPSTVSFRSFTTQKCIDEWPDHKDYCNTFVEAVAQDCGVSLSGLADHIVDTITSDDWEQLPDGVAASAAAANGRLVIAGLRAAELGDQHGHVVVVVEPTGPLAFGKYPYAYWGSENVAIRDKGGEGTTLNWSFTKAVRDNVHYASHSVTGSGQR